MKYIYFYDGKKEHLIDTALNYDGAWKVAINYIKETLKVEPYYYRECVHDDVITIDYGSHYQFIYIREGD